MAIYRLARREPLRRVTAALQPLAREVAIACGLRLAVTRLRGSENVNLYETVHERAVMASAVRDKPFPSRLTLYSAFLLVFLVEVLNGYS